MASSKESRRQARFRKEEDHRKLLFYHSRFGTVYHQDQTKAKPTENNVWTRGIT